MKGWIKLHRVLKEWEWYSDINATRLLIHLLINVNYDDKKWRGIIIKKGSMVFSWDSLSKESNLSIQQCRTAMKKLKYSKEVTIKSTNKYQVVTLVKWDKFQFADDDVNKQTNNQITSKQQSNNNQITTTKEIKENNNNNKQQNSKKITNAKAVNIINNNKFKKEVINDLQFMEVTAMQTKQKLPKIKYLLDSFEKHLIQIGSQKKDIGEFKRHFSNWLLKQDLKKSYTYKKIRYM